MGLDWIEWAEIRMGWDGRGLDGMGWNGMG